MKNNFTKGFKADLTDLEKINQFSRRSLNIDEIYTFSVILCDNEVDRDYERFTVKTLNDIAKLFVGKTGIFDHNPKGQNQTARIYETQVIIDESKITSLGEKYTYVKAKAYMVKTQRNADLMLEIDAGIKKEVSVSCSVQKIKCSICDKDIKNDCCEHQKGKVYGGQMCHHLLIDAIDAYEWSFVAVPAQKNAGITKSYINKSEVEMKNTNELLKSFSAQKDSFIVSKKQANELLQYISILKQTAQLGKQYKEDLIAEVKRLSFLCNENISADIINSVLEKMDILELKEFKKVYSQKVNKDNISIQLMPNQKDQLNQSTNYFKLD